MTSPADDSDDLIKIDDFQSIELRISFENETTRTAVKDGKRIYGEKKSKREEDLSILLLEFSDDGMILEVPANSCAQGHRLSLVILAEGLPASSQHPKGTLEFKASANVVSTEKAGKARDQIEIRLIDFEDHEWAGLRDIYADRQRQITEFFQAIRS